MREPKNPKGAETSERPPGELAVPAGAIAAPGSVEVLRAWIVDSGLHVTLLPAFETPDMWGMLLADVARHAARAFVKEKRCTEDEAMRAIVAILVAELDNPTDPGTTEQVKNQ